MRLRARKSRWHGWQSWSRKRRLGDACDAMFGAAGWQYSPALTFSDPFLFQPLRILTQVWKHVDFTSFTRNHKRILCFFWPETRDWTWLKPHKGVLFRATVMEMWFDFSYENTDSKNERTEANNPGKRFDHSLAGSMRSVYWWWKRGKTLESRWKTQQNYIYIYYN